MNLKQALRKARDILVKNSFEDAPLEGELLLRHTLKIDRVQLYLELDKELTPQQEQTFRNLPRILDGDLDKLIDTLSTSEQAKQLEEQLA